MNILLGGGGGGGEIAWVQCDVQNWNEIELKTLIFDFLFRFFSYIFFILHSCHVCVETKILKNIGDVRRISVAGYSDQVQHKSACAAT